MVWEIDTMRARVFLLSVLLLLIGAVGIMPALTQPGAVTELSPQIVLRAINLGDTIRYTASLIKPADLELETASFSITLPGDADVAAVFETDRVTFTGVQRDPEATTLVWSAEDLGAASAIDALTFTLAEELSTDMEVYVQYVGSTVGAVSVSGKPEIAPALAAEEGDLVIGPNGTGARMLPVGASGVRVGVAAGLLDDETTIVARQLPMDQNPPPDLTTDEGAAFWWCSLVQIDDLPAGSAVSVMVPARRPIAPFTPVRLFALQPDGTWLPLEALGIVSADGQYIQYVHPGGVIAAGVERSYQPQIVEDLVELPGLTMPFSVAPAPADSADEEPSEAIASVSSRPQPVDGTTPRGMPACDAVEDASTPCQTDVGSVRVCQPGLLNCTFTFPDGRLCFRPTVPDEPICEIGVTTDAELSAPAIDWGVSG